MGTFEKLGILVIVVIIVMILAVAIYQWGGAAEPATPTPDLPDPLTIRYLDELEAQHGEPDPRAGDDPAPDADTWPGGVPKTYEVQPNDSAWVLVFNRWKLKDTFIPVIAAANPAVKLELLRPGQKLVIPDPAAYVRKSGAARTSGRRANTRRYKIQEGDNLESIAYRHLGSRRRWTDIENLNPGLDRKRLRVGQEIYLPLK
ncbi:MAG: LysM peptidoglycan-binding domain-containing protein [Planctomycetota bacterium]|jgi:nucleoid-associated protein YgaU